MISDVPNWSADEGHCLSNRVQVAENLESLEPGCFEKPRPPRPSGPSGADGAHARIGNGATPITTGNRRAGSGHWLAQHTPTPSSSNVNVEFARDSPLEGDGFELPVPLI
jgi:hypothetical protein